MCVIQFPEQVPSPPLVKALSPFLTSPPPCYTLLPPSSLVCTGHCYVTMMLTTATDKQVSRIGTIRKYHFRFIHCFLNHARLPIPGQDSTRILYLTIFGDWFTNHNCLSSTPPLCSLVTECVGVSRPLHYNAHIWSNHPPFQTSLLHDTGAGLPCTVCEDLCPGLEIHYWR